ncbi:CRISPR-associated endonuclease Cas2 [Clostridium sp. 19966]|uniref:CRISPR-associated endonuclease Cas2 n=1 Tax=Clostridium sp. 19966 TaxID=2768166 RepID=UPI0028E043E7|nr:CRISPR-associated endonuclease Cas2 [Clostridium sp. 19966]MDT8719409.1 CRISPR-associated endonuclease Cas2 [Clostridium sp. 19966]
MPKNLNYNYAFVFYDVNEKRVNRVFKVCKKYFKHHQKSIFRGNITPANLIKLRADLKKEINPNEDFISIIKFMSEASFEEETLGKNYKDSEALIL